MTLYTSVSIFAVAVEFEVAMNPPEPADASASILDHVFALRVISPPARVFAQSATPKQSVCRRASVVPVRVDLACAPWLPLINPTDSPTGWENRSTSPVAMTNRSFDNVRLPPARADTLILSVALAVGSLTETRPAPEPVPRIESTSLETAVREVGLVTWNPDADAPAQTNRLFAPTAGTAPGAAVIAASKSTEFVACVLIDSTFTSPAPEPVVISDLATISPDDATTETVPDALISTFPTTRASISLDWVEFALETPTPTRPAPPPPDNAASADIPAWPELASTSASCVVIDTAPWEPSTVAFSVESPVAVTVGTATFTSPAPEPPRSTAVTSLPDRACTARSPTVCERLMTLPRSTVASNRVRSLAVASVSVTPTIPAPEPPFISADTLTRLPLPPAITSRSLALTVTVLPAPPVHACMTVFASAVVFGASTLTSPAPPPPFCSARTLTSPEASTRAERTPVFIMTPFAR